MCSGFVQINRRVSPGGVFNHISTYNGPQFIFTIQMWKVGLVNYQKLNHIFFTIKLVVCLTQD